MEEQKDIRWIQRYVNYPYSDYAPLLKKLDEDLNVLSQNEDYKQA